MRIGLVTLLVCAPCVLLAAARGEAVSPKPPAQVPLAPVEASRAAFPADNSETLVVETRNTPEFIASYGSGYIKAPLAAVFAALKDPEVLVDRRRIDTWHADPPGVEVPLTFKVRNTMHGMVVVDFETTWRVGVIAGTAAQPKAVCARGQKTAGSGLVNVLDDSIAASTVDAHTTAIEIVRHLKGTNVQPKDAEGYLRDVYANVLAKAHGEPLPKYR